MTRLVALGTGCRANRLHASETGDDLLSRLLFGAFPQYNGHDDTGDDVVKFVGFDGVHAGDGIAERATVRISRCIFNWCKSGIHTKLLWYIIQLVYSRLNSHVQVQTKGV